MTVHDESPPFHKDHFMLSHSKKYFSPLLTSTGGEGWSASAEQHFCLLLQTQLVGRRKVSHLGETGVAQLFPRPLSTLGHQAVFFQPECHRAGPAGAEGWGSNCTGYRDRWSSLARVSQLKTCCQQLNAQHTAQNQFYWD